MNLREALAANLRASRARAGIGQAELAEGMRKLGFDIWVRQTVSSSEHGTRRVTAEEVYGLALILETNIASLMNIWQDGVVMFPGDGEIVPRQIAAPVVQRPTIWWRE